MRTLPGSRFGTRQSCGFRALAANTACNASRACRPVAECAGCRSRFRRLAARTATGCARPARRRPSGRRSECSSVHVVVARGVCRIGVAREAVPVERGILQHVDRRAASSARMSISAQHVQRVAHRHVVDLAHQVAVTVDRQRDGVAQGRGPEQRQHEVRARGTPQRPRVWPKSSVWRSMPSSLATSRMPPRPKTVLTLNAHEVLGRVLQLELHHAVDEATRRPRGCRRNC